MNDQNLVTIQHANETRPGHNLVGNWWKHGHKSASILQAFLHQLSGNTKTAIAFCKNKKLINLIFFFFIIRAGRCVNRAGRKTVRAGRSALRNRPSWNTAHACWREPVCRYCRSRYFLGHYIFHIRLMGAGWWRAGGVVDERYVTLGGCTVQRYKALQGGVGVSSFPEKSATYHLTGP